MVERLVYDIVVRSTFGHDANAWNHYSSGIVLWLTRDHETYSASVRIALAMNGSFRSFTIANTSGS